MQLPIPSADPITHRVYEAKCIAEIERLNAEEQKNCTVDSTGK
jgi:hypothetical protein